MCQNLPMERVSPSPMAVKLAKVTVILIVFCFIECASGSCLSYGHSCWGGHGKRNDPSNVATRDGTATNDVPIDTRWFLSRLYQGPADLRQWKSKDNVLPGHEHQMLRENVIAEGLKSIQEDDLPDAQDPAPVSDIFADEPHLRAWQEKLRVYNLLKAHKLN